MQLKQNLFNYMIQISNLILNRDFHNSGELENLRAFINFGKSKNLDCTQGIFNRVLRF